jgi:type II secretory pathway pseudopilin PulG
MIPPLTKRPAFSMAELLIVICIVAIVAGILTSFIQYNREVLARVNCTSNLKMIGLATLNFEATFGRLPPLYGGSDGVAVQNSAKNSTVWASTHVLLLTYIEQDYRFQSLANGAIPPVFDPTTFPTGSPGITGVVSTYVCPADPSMNDGIIIGGKYGGTSYAANAQVLAPLTDESLNGGSMNPATKPDFTDRGAKASDIKDGLANTTLFTHSYALCGSANTGTVWGNGAGVNKPPSPINTFQPWSRASYLGQTYMTPANGYAFQDRPNLKDCKVSDPASPHPGSMLVGMSDGAIRPISSKILPDIWNKVCLPNDGSELGNDW